MRRNPAVSAVTRRRLHERPLRPLIGSEAAYDDPFAEDYAEATAVLGRLRIEQSVDGLLTVTATSASAGRVPTDWVAAPAALSIAEREDESASASDSGSSASSEHDGGGEEYDCGRCGRHLGRTDYGWKCDNPNCPWGACPSCHPGGTRARLLCPKHS